MPDLSKRPAVFTLTPGPVPLYPRVAQALASPVPYEYDPHFKALYEEICIKAARAMRTSAPAMLLQVEPAAAIEAAAASLIGPDDVVLNLASGIYGKGFGYWALRYCREMIEIEVPYDEAIDPAAVAAAFAKRPDIKVVSLVHHDTPTGTINPVDAIGRIVRDHGALLLVDAVSSFGGMDVHPDASCSDVFITGPAKALGGSPGLSMLAVNERAWAHMAANPKAPFASILSLSDWKDAWSRDKRFPFTPSVAEVHGLGAALDLYFEEGPEAVWARHARMARACREGVKAMGLALWPKTEAIASPTCTTVRVPEGVGSHAIVDAARSRYGVMFSTGRGSVENDLVRIGHAGVTAEPIYAAVAVTALGGALRHLGVTVDIGAGVEAATAAMTAD